MHVVRATEHTKHAVIIMLSLLLGIALFEMSTVAQERDAKADIDSSTSQTPVQWQKIAIPDTKNPNELRLFIESLQKRQPANRAQYVEMQQSINTAAEIALKHQSDRQSELGQFLENAFVNSSVMLMSNDGEDAPMTTMNRLLEYLRSTKKPSQNDLKMGMLACQNLEQLTDRGIAKKAYQDLIDVLLAKQDKDLDSWVALLKGNVKRLDSIGKQIELKAKTIDGQEIDLKSMRGHYTLLYFWASWDQSTQVELAYLKQIADKYKDQGFRILTLSFDSDESVLKNFIESQQFPWPVLWEPGDDWAPNIVQKYGISAIPTPILLDKEGKVIHLEARGLMLGKLLGDIFDPKSTTSSSGTAP